jgi:hypothetical protein
MKPIHTLVAFLFVIQLSAQDTAVFFTDANAFFSTHVSNGRVDYKAIKSDSSTLDDLLAQAGEIRVTMANPATYQSFWINTYNLAVIKGIVSKYPVASPLKIGGFFDNMTFDVGGVQTTLNNIENTLLRAKFPSEARFHFVLVCAGLGCPPLIGEAYTPAKLETQLQRQTTIALNNPNFIKVNGNKVEISQIFEWYKEDFTKNGSVIKYINSFRRKAIPTKAKVSYYSYDWTLNDSE